MRVSINRSHLREAAIAAGLFALALMLSAIYLSRAELGNYYQEEFSPAVAFACSGEFKPLAATSAALEEFLHRKAATFNCADLPPVVGAPFDIWQRQHLYLILAIGLIWSLVGVSWPASIVVSALLAGGFVLAVYSVARCFVPIGWAVATTAAAALSPYHVRMLPEVRDYSKAAFIVAAIFFGCRLAASPPTAQRSFALGGLAGLVIGVGFGFRPDLAMAVPFLALVLLLVLLATRLRAWRHVLFAGIAFAVTFMLVSAPMLGAYQQGGVLGFASLNGLMTPFSVELGLTPPLYDLGHLFLDSYIGALVHAYAVKFAPAGVWPDITSQYPHFGGYSLRLFLEFARDCPADMLIRAYASILKVLSPHTRDMALTPFNPGLLLVLLALAVIAADAPVAGATLALAIVYFGGLGALQFHPRHLFHLEFLAWLAAAIVGAAAVRLRRRQISPRCLLHGAWLPIAGMTAAALLLAAARAYQEQHLADMFGSYLQAERQPVAVQDEPRGHFILVRPNGPIPDMIGSSTPLSDTPRGYYFDAVFDARRCGGQSVNAKVIYSDVKEDFSRELTVSLDGADHAHMLFPAFTDLDHHFIGVELSDAQRGCLRRLDAVTGYKSLPLPLWLRLPANWREYPLYQAIAR